MWIKCGKVRISLNWIEYVSEREEGEITIGLRSGSMLRLSGEAAETFCQYVKLLEDATGVADNRAGTPPMGGLTQ